MSVAPFPVPATSHAACGFPALRAPAHFATRFMRPIRSEPLSPSATPPLLTRASAQCQGRSAFLLPYSRPDLRSCRLLDAFIIRPCLTVLTTTSCAARPLHSTGVTPLPSYYGPSRHPLAFHRFPGCRRLYGFHAPPISRRDEEGFSSCLACPCHRAVPTTPPE